MNTSVKTVVKADKRPAISCTLSIPMLSGIIGIPDNSAIALNLKELPDAIQQELANSKLDSLDLAPAMVNQDGQDILALLRLRDKVLDAAAIKRDTTTGLSASWGEKAAAMQSVYDALKRGEWSTRAPAGESVAMKALDKVELLQECFKILKVKRSISGLKLADVNKILAMPKVVGVLPEAREALAKRKAEAEAFSLDDLGDLLS